MDQGKGFKPYPKNTGKPLKVYSREMQCFYLAIDGLSGCGMDNGLGRSKNKAEMKILPHPLLSPWHKLL